LLNALLRRVNRRFPMRKLRFWRSMKLVEIATVYAYHAR
jgi:hypothetical protein